MQIAQPLCEVREASGRVVGGRVAAAERSPEVHRALLRIVDGLPRQLSDFPAVAEERTPASAHAAR